MNVGWFMMLKSCVIDVTHLGSWDCCKLKFGEYGMQFIYSGVGVRLKVGGGKNWEQWRGGVWGGAVPSQLGVWGKPQKKNQFCAKNYAILSKFWYFFPILQHKNFQHAKIVTSASEKVGGLSPVLKVWTYPLSPLLRRLCLSIIDWWFEHTATR